MHTIYDVASFVSYLAVKKKSLLQTKIRLL